MPRSPRERRRLPFSEKPPQPAPFTIPLAPRQGTDRLIWLDQHDAVIAIDVCAEIDKMTRQGWDAGDAADACRQWWLGQVDDWVKDGITRYLARRWTP